MANRIIEYDGRKYSSIKEFTKAYNLQYQQTVNKLNSGYTPEQIVKGLKKSDVELDESDSFIEYQGKKYPSLLKLCQENNLKYHKICKLRRQGMSIEEILKYEDVTVSDVDRVYSISNMSKGMKTIFEDNPYCVLGLPCNAARNEALERRDKLEKINRLGVVESFNSEFDLKGVEKPNRELGHIQIVLNNLDKLDYRWMWYLSSCYADNWKNEQYIEMPCSVQLEYDTFLACIYNGLITDPRFQNKNKWTAIFAKINYVFGMEDAVLYRYLSSRITENDRAKYNYRMVVNSFREALRNTIASSIDSGDGTTLLNIVLLLNDLNGSFEEQFKENINTWVLRWVDHIIGGTKEALEKVRARDGLNKATSNDATIMCNLLEKLTERDFIIAEKISQNLDSLHGEMMMNRIKEVIYESTIVLGSGGRKRDACKYDSMIYIYCTDKQKSEIRRVYPVEWWQIPDSAFSADECINIASDFEKKKDWENGFVWMMKAANKGSAAAQNDIGVYYALGRGRKTNNYLAYKWFKKAADNGSAVAYGNLAHRYYDGTFPCQKDKDKAKEYWITAYKLNRNGGFDNKLDKYFPGWRGEKHPLLTFSERDWRYRLRPYAEDGISDAEYWYGVIIYKGIHGCSEDKLDARRWFLRAAVHDHSLAIRDLKKYYGIDATELKDANSMFNRGASLRKSEDEQEQDLAFYWICKAQEKGFDDADNLIGVCYSEGVGVVQNKEKACEYYLRSIQKKNNAGALYNYAYNLFYGTGVVQDKEKAKEYFLKAKDQGNKGAIEFLKTHFGIEDKYRSFDYGDFEDITLYDKNIHIEFCGLKTQHDNILLSFWIRNNDSEEHQFWLKNISYNGSRIKGITKIGGCDSGESSFFYVEIEATQDKNEDCIEFAVEVDDDGTEELFTLDTVRVKLFNRIHFIKYEILQNTGRNIPTTNYKTSTNDDDDEGNEDYLFAYENFEDVLIYEEKGLRIEFGGFIVKDDEVYAKIWSKNSSRKTYRLWAKDIVVDDDRVSEYEVVATRTYGSAWQGDDLLIEGVDLETYYDVEFTIEINDKDDNALDVSKRIKSRIDFSDEEISVELVDHVDFDEDDEDSEETDDLDGVIVDDEDDSEEEDSDETESTDEEDDRFGLDNFLRVEGSYCVVNSEQNGLEVYFPAMPSEFVRATLKDAGWRWHRQKQCWYAKDSSARRALVKKITGNDVKG